jgi:hypothetical protein
MPAAPDSLSSYWLAQQGPGPQKVQRQIFVSPETAGRLESLYHAIDAWIEDNEMPR